MTQQEEMEKLKTEIHNLKDVVGSLVSILVREIGEHNAKLLIEALHSEKRSDL